MAFFRKFFDKTDKVDYSKLKLQSQISVQYAIADNYVISLAAQQRRLDILQNYLRNVSEIDADQKIEVLEEINNMEYLIEAYQSLVKENLFIKFQNNISDNISFLIQPFILFPIVQNALRYGYNTLEKYPLRIKIHLVNNTLKLEVSNRVNHNLENQAQNSIIENLKARLEIYYKQKYNLLINSNTNIFKVTLIIF